MEEKPKIKFIFPFFAYIGTVFGVGLYSLPYVMNRSGVWVYLIFLAVVAPLVFLANAMFAEVVMVTPTKQRFLGYIGAYFGKKVERFFGWVTLIGFWGTFLAYIIVWGEFAETALHGILPLGSAGFSILFFVLTFFAIYKGSKAVESSDVIMLLVVGALLIVLYVIGAPHIGGVATTPESIGGYVLPYGTLMFALWGAGVIPEVVNQLRDRPKRIKQLLIWGKVVPVLIGLSFALFVASISGSSTTKEAFEGLEPFIGRTAVIVGSLIGMITIALSYTNLGWVARNILKYDLRLPRIQSVLGAVLPPLILFIVGFHNFVLLMSVVGAVFLGIQGLMIFALYKKTHAGSSQRGSKIFTEPFKPWIIKMGIALFVCGVIAELGLVVYEFVTHSSI